MRRSTVLKAAAITVLTALIAPTAAFAQEEPINPQELLPNVISELNVTWVLLGTVLVFFMQAGFAFLEIGLSRGKNAGAGIAKILVNFSVASIVWWAVGFAIAFGGPATIAGDSGLLLPVRQGRRG